jgi:hypothetical protein
VTAQTLRGAHPDAVPGWWLDHRLGEVAGCPVYAARRATALRPGAPPEYATVLLAPGDEPARAALAALGSPTPADALPLTGVGTQVALVLPPHVTPPAEPLARAAGTCTGGRPAGGPPGAVGDPPTGAPASDERSFGPGEAAPAAAALARRATTPRRAAVTGTPALVLLAALGLAVLVIAALRLVAPGLAGRDRPAAATAVPVDDAAVGWDAETATATVVQQGETHRFVLGAPGDQLLVGDWDGDRVRTPGLYRSTTGELWVFDRWAAAGEPAGARPLERGATLGTARVVRREGRDTIVVEPPSP